MPKVHTIKKNSAGKEISCGRCGKKIEVGQIYFSWSFRYGGKHIRCSNHWPRQSELTQSKMSAVYAAIESVEDQLESFHRSNNISEVTSALESAADEVESVADEYEDSRNNMPEGLQDGEVGQQCQDNADALREFAESLHNAVNEINGEYDAESREGEISSDIIDSICGIAEDALESLSI